MQFCVVCSLCVLLRFKINPEQQPPTSADLTRELDDLDRFTFNSLTALLGVLAIPGSKTLSPVVLAFLVYTISLRLAVSSCFVQKHPAVTRFLHVVPLLGTLCMTAVELVLSMRSPALAVAVLLLGILPFVTTVLHHGAEGVPLPVRMQNMPAPVAGHPAPATPN